LRCVFDTNVLVSALLLPDSKPSQAFELALQKKSVLISHAMLSELHEALGRKKFHRYVDEEDMRSFLAALAREAEWVDVDVKVKACRDPRDDKFRELAVSGRGTHILPGDADLRALIPFQGFEILVPGEFLELGVGPDSDV
jgi:putative PIN family toxin of toxin-antitoxin system